jgi:hypothetical protein
LSRFFLSLEKGRSFSRWADGGVLSASEIKNHPFLTDDYKIQLLTSLLEQIQSFFFPLSFCNKGFRNFFVNHSVGKNGIRQRAMPEKKQKVFESSGEKRASRFTRSNRARSVKRRAFSSTAGGICFGNHFVPIKQLNALHKRVKIVTRILGNGHPVWSLSFHAANASINPQIPRQVNK